jgi:hypothetical protein
MDEHEGNDRPTYILSYSRWISLARTGAAILLLAVALVRLVLAWVRFLRPLLPPVVDWVWGTTQTFPPVGDIVSAQPLRPFFAAHLSLLFVACAIAFLYAILPDLSLDDDGLLVRGFRGWRLVPWPTIQVARIMSFQKEGQRLVLLQGNWTRWSPWPRLVSACLGAGLEPGVLLTSAIRDFKPLMLRLYQEVKATSPEALFDDEFLSPSAAITVEPTPTLNVLAEQARDEGWPLSVSAQAMAAVPGGLVLVQLLLLVMVGGAWWKPVLIIGLCELEWLMGSFYLYAMAELFPASIEFQEAALLYPIPQIPRALMALPMAMLVAAGLVYPAALAELAGVLWAVILTALLVQRMYRLESILPAMIGGALQALYQFMILGIVFSG